MIPWVHALQFVPLWVFQSVAAFPTRYERAPVIVYACVLVALALAYATGPWRDARWRRTFGVMLMLWLVPPFIFEGLTFSSMGGVWQGRYSMPYLVGLAVVLLAWPTGRRETPLRRVLPLVALLTYAVANVVSIVNLLRLETDREPARGRPTVVGSPGTPLVALILLGTLLQFAPSFSHRLRPSAPEPVPLQHQDVVAEQSH